MHETVRTHPACTNLI